MYVSGPDSETFHLNFHTVCEFKVARLRYLFDLQLKPFGLTPNHPL